MFCEVLPPGCTPKQRAVIRVAKSKLGTELLKKIKATENEKVTAEDELLCKQLDEWKANLKFHDDFSDCINYPLKCII